MTLTNLIHNYASRDWHKNQHSKKPQKKQWAINCERHEQEEMEALEK